MKPQLFTKGVKVLPKFKNYLITVVKLILIKLFLKSEDLLQISMLKENNNLQNWAINPGYPETNLPRGLICKITALVQMTKPKPDSKTCTKKSRKRKTKYLNYRVEINQFLLGTSAASKSIKGSTKRCLTWLSERTSALTRNHLVKLVSSNWAKLPKMPTGLLIRLW
jgi:hypothetical protein